MNHIIFINSVVSTSVKYDKLPELAKYLSYFAVTHDILNNMPRSLIEEGEPLKIIEHIIKNAEAKNLLEELSEFINYFAGSQRLIALTGGDINVLRVIEDILSDSVKLKGLLSTAIKQDHPIRTRSAEEVNHRLKLIAQHSDLSSPENIEAGVYASFGGKAVCLADKKLHLEATAWIEYINDVFATLRNLRDASRN